MTIGWAWRYGSISRSGSALVLHLRDPVESVTCPTVDGVTLGCPVVMHGVEHRDSEGSLLHYELSSVEVLPTPLTLEALAGTVTLGRDLARELNDLWAHDRGADQQR